MPFKRKQLHIYAADKKNTSIFINNLRIFRLFDHPNDLTFFLKNKKSNIKYLNYYVEITQQDFDLTSKCANFIIVIYFCVGINKNTNRLVVDTYKFQNCKIMRILGIFLDIIAYGFILWGICLTNKFNQVFILQMSAIRIHNSKIKI